MANHYELLDIPRDAQESAIKSAWARKVRQHPPDQDPETNRLLNEAKATLLDVRARADYDAQLLFGDELSQLFEEAYEAMEAEEYEDAIRAFKEILALNPGSLEARNRLALAYSYDERYEEAVAQLQRLVAEVSDSALYASNLGSIYMAWGQEEAERLPMAERWLKKATELESYNTGHYITLARFYRRSERYQEAEDAIEQAIGADGKIDIDDIDAMMELTWLFVVSRQMPRVSELATRVRSVLPDDPDALAYAAFKFLRTAAELADDYSAYQDAVVFVEAARMIDPDFGGAHGAVNAILRGARAELEADQMANDESIQPKVVGAILAALTHRRLGFEVSDQALDALTAAAETWSRWELKIGAANCRRKYPTACEYIDDLMESVTGLGTDDVPARPAASSGGCSVLLLLGVLLSLFAILWH